MWFVLLERVLEDVNRQRLRMLQGSSYTVALKSCVQISDSRCIICLDLLQVGSVL